MNLEESTETNGVHKTKPYLTNHQRLQEENIEGRSKHFLG